MKCDCGNECKQQGTYRKEGKLIPRFQCLKCGKIINKERKFKHLSQETIDLIIKLRSEKMELRKISRVLQITHSAVIYQLKKNGMNGKRSYKIFPLISHMDSRLGGVGVCCVDIHRGS
jgi:transposase-like protein